jgi:predicted RNA-binding protein with TRAM domain
MGRFNRYDKSRNRESSFGESKRYDRSRNRESSFGESKSFRKTPIRVGEEYDIKIEDISKRGDAGVTRIGGLVVFVNNTSPGERAKIRITKVEEAYATGEVLDQIQKNEDVPRDFMQARSELKLAKLAQTPGGKEIFERFGRSLSETKDTMRAYEAAVRCAEENGSLTDFQDAIINDIFIAFRPFIESVFTKSLNKPTNKTRGRYR